MNTIIRSSDFDAWLAALANHQAKAGILARITAAKLGTSATASLSAKVFPRCGFTWARAIASISHVRR